LKKPSEYLWGRELGLKMDVRASLPDYSFAAVLGEVAMMAGAATIATKTRAIRKSCIDNLFLIRS
jgi:hypothetical protein